MRYMLKFKAGMFSGSVLTITVFFAAIPAFAQSQVPSQDTVIQNTAPVTPATVPEIKDNDSQAPKTGSLELSDSNVQFLKSFNDRHKCGIANIDTAISRADFANNIVVCLTSTEVKLAQDPSAISASELAQLKEVVEQFSNEVSYLGNRLETVEKKLATVQKASTFSTTTKLAGEVIVALSTVSSQTGQPAADTNGGNTVFGNRVRLNFDTSFTGKDRLRTRLESRNLIQLDGGTTGGGTGTSTTRLGFDGDGGNTTNLSLLQYTLPISDQSRLLISTVGSEFNDDFYTFNPQFTSAGNGALTRFGRFNPVYRQSGNGAAVNAELRFSPQISASLGYALPGNNANNPGVGSTGVFGSGNAGLVQLRYQPSQDLDLGLIFARSYHPGGGGVTGGTGSSFAQNPFNGLSTTANHYSFLASSKLSPTFTLSGWVGLTNASIDNVAARTGNADIFNAAITASIADVGAKGNVLGFIVGIPPTVSSISTNAPATATANPSDRFNTATALHLEALYKIRVSDNLEITPGVLLITNPESQPNTPNRGSEFVGTVRSTFRF
jgi:Carbohydrate-selective porin, OprB family